MSADLVPRTRKHYEPAQCVSDRVLSRRGWTEPDLAHLGDPDAHKRGGVPAWGAERVLLAEVALPDLQARVSPHDRLSGRGALATLPWPVARFAKIDGMGWTAVALGTVNDGDLVLVSTADGPRLDRVIRVRASWRGAHLVTTMRSGEQVPDAVLADLPATFTTTGPLRDLLGPMGTSEA